LYHVLDGAKEAIEALLYVRSDRPSIVGHNVAFDMVCTAAEWPELIPAIFDAYAADAITDTMLREKLQHIALGIYRGFERRDGKAIKLHYSLEDCVMRKFGIKLEKGGWQLRYGELREIPLSFWDQAAIDYPKIDAEATLALYVDQQSEGIEFLVDEFRQARAAFWMQLMSTWGMTLDPVAVDTFERMTIQQLEDVQALLIEHGLMRVNGSRNLAAATDHMVSVCHKIGIPVRRNKATDKNREGSVKLDKDSCKLTNDPILNSYAQVTALQQVIGQSIPKLKLGRAHVKWDLLKTGRTSQSPNFQNLPRKPGQRECLVPRPGHVFAVADYSAFELRTVSQICYTVLGHSRLREALNAGFDPHLEMARRILGISYEEALTLKKSGDHDLDQARQAGKIANFGFPGGLGIARFVDYAREQYDVIVTEDESRALKHYWQEAWPEMVDYHKWIGDQTEHGASRIKCLFSERWMGGLKFTEAANGLYQALAVDAAKNAGFMIARECYAIPDSVLFGSRPVNFPHDEFLVETLDNEYAHDCAIRLGKLMVDGARPFLPDVEPIAEPYLTRRFSKSAKPIYKNGRLVPWDIAV
jgi:DNA polymerase-1